MGKVGESVEREENSCSFSVIHTLGLTYEIGIFEEVGTQFCGV